MKSTAALGVAALTLTMFALLAGCSGTSVAPVVPSKDAQGRYVIHMTAGNQFQPANAQVPKGATVTWVNDAEIQHDVQENNKAFSSGGAGGLSATGSHYEYTFYETGSFGYYCTIHKGSGMTGTVTVVAA